MDTVSMKDYVAQVLKIQSDSNAIANESARVYSDIGDIRSKSADILQRSAEQITQNADTVTARVSEIDAANKQALNTIDFAGIMQRTVESLNNSFARQKELNQQITKVESIQFLDNPVDWVMGQLQIDGLRGEYEGVTNDIAITSGHMKNLESLAQTHMQTGALSLDALTQGTRAIVAKGEAAKLQVQANDQLIGKHITNINQLEALQKADMTTLEMMDAIVRRQDWERSAALREEQFALTRQNAELARIQKEQAIAAGKDADTQRKLRADAEADELRILNAGARELRRPEFVSLAAAQRMRGTTDGKELYQRLYDIGYQADSRAAGGLETMQIGRNVMDTAETVSKLGGTLPPSQRKLAEVILGPYNARVAGTDPKTVEGQQARVVAEQEIMRKIGELGEYRRDVTADKDNNPFAPMPAHMFVPSFPELQKSPVFKKLIAPVLAANTTAEIPPSEMMTLMMAGVASRDPATQVTLEQAASFASQYYKTMKMKVNMEQNLAGYGVAPLKTYNVKLASDPNAVVFTGSKIYDLSSPEQVKEYMLRRLVVEAGGSSFTPLPTGPAQAGQIVDRMRGN